MKEVKQEKLKATEIAKTLICADMLRWAFKWDRTPEGYDWWAIVEGKLQDISKHGTTDGKPYVEPKRWRVPTDEDARMRPECRVRDHEDQEWQQATLYIVDDKLSEVYRYFARLKDGGVFEWWYECEILSETKTE